MRLLLEFLLLYWVFPLLDRKISLLVVEFPELEEGFSFLGVCLSFLLDQKEAIPTEGSS